MIANKMKTIIYQPRAPIQMEDLNLDITIETSSLSVQHTTVQQQQVTKPVITKQSKSVKQNSKRTRSKYEQEEEEEEDIDSIQIFAPQTSTQSDVSTSSLVEPPTKRRRKLTARYTDANSWSIFDKQSLFKQ